MTEAEQIASTLVEPYKADLAPYRGLTPTLDDVRKFVVRYFRQPGRVYPGHLMAGEIAKALYALIIA
jgi:hypothetical protein